MVPSAVWKNAGSNSSSWKRIMWLIFVSVIPPMLVLRMLWDLYRFRFITVKWGPYGTVALQALEVARQQLLLEAARVRLARCACGPCAVRSGHARGGGAQLSDLPPAVRRGPHRI